MTITEFIDGFGLALQYAAEISAHLMEFIGIIIIIVGSAKAIAKQIHYLRRKRSFNVVVDLGKSLSLALEFKMGAEIITTVIVRNMEELAILAIVIVIRALLAFFIHWEMKMEKSAEAIPEKKKDE